MEIVILGVFVLLVIAVIGLFFLAIWKTPKVGRLISVCLIGGIIFFIITGIWPSDSFYINEFEINSKVSLDKNFKILEKESSYPDMHGDYYSKAIFKVSNLDLSNLAVDLKKNNECDIPELAKPYLNKGVGSISCWAVNRNTDEWFNLIYSEKIGILYYEFNQT